MLFNKTNLRMRVSRENISLLKFERECSKSTHNALMTRRTSGAELAPHCENKSLVAIGVYREEVGNDPYPTRGEMKG